MSVTTDIIRIRAERDAARAALAAIEAQAEDATEYVLAMINRELRADADALAAALGDADCPRYGGKIWACAEDGEDECALCAALAAYRERRG